MCLTKISKKNKITIHCGETVNAELNLHPQGTIL